MGHELLCDLAQSLALGGGDAAELRAGLVGALDRLGLALPGVAPMDGAALAAGDGHTLVVFVDDFNGLASFRVYADAALPDVVVAALDRVNGVCAAGSTDLGGGELLHAFVRVLCLAGVAPELAAWLRDEDRADPACPTQEEADALDRIPTIAAVVVHDDGALPKHGPRPPVDFLARRFTRVVALRLAM